jgi:hypothetical protein
MKMATIRDWALVAVADRLSQKIAITGFVLAEEVVWNAAAE